MDRQLEIYLNLMFAAEKLFIQHGKKISTKRKVNGEYNYSPDIYEHLFVESNGRIMIMWDRGNFLRAFSILSTTEKPIYLEGKTYLLDLNKTYKSKAVEPHKAFKWLLQNT